MTTATITVTYSYFYSCVHLLNIMTRVPTMRYVAQESTTLCPRECVLRDLVFVSLLQVLKKNMMQMLTTLILVFILIYIFSVFSYTAPQ